MNSASDEETWNVSISPPQDGEQQGSLELYRTEGAEEAELCFLQACRAMKDWGQKLGFYVPSPWRLGKHERLD